MPQFTVDTNMIAHFGNVAKVARDHKWGYEIWFVNDEYCCKLIVLTEPGVKSSFHCHWKKKETFTVLSGRVHIETADLEVKSADYSAGQSVTMLPYQRHQFWAIDKPALILESSTHHQDCDTHREGV